jgi:hypothetical protein
MPNLIDNIILTTTPTLDDIGDVSATSVVSGEFLKYNGTNWVNEVITLGEDTTGNYLSDVTAGSGITVTHTPGEGSSPTVAVTANTFEVFGSISNHAAITANVHGIADTSILVTTTGAQTLTNKTITSPVGLVKGDVGLGNVDNTADTAKPVSTAQQTALDLKANLASPTFTGTPTLPTGTIATTQTAGDSSTAVATTAFVSTAVSNLVDSAPEALNTLDELAAALGDDANFATTVSTNIGLKAPIDSPTFTGTVTLPANTVTSTMIADSTIVNADISASAAIALTKLADIAAGSVLMGNTSNTATATALTGDVTVNSTGVTAIGSGVIVNADISETAAIALTKLADISTNAQVGNYTLVLTDKNKIVEMNVGSANNLTVPLNSSVAFPVGSQINILQTGIGQTTIVATVGVTINSTPGLKMRAQFSYATLIKRATDTWVLVGDISA